MSLFHSYDPAPEAVLNPRDATDPIPGFPETVVITFQPSLLDWAAAQSGAEELCRIPVFFQMPVLRLPYGRANLGVYQTLMGGAVSAAMLEEVIARGGRKFVLFGSCGSLSQAIPAGHLVVPTAAYRDEGVSYHYLPAEDYITIPTAERTASILRALHLPFQLGKAWTTDALYRETHRNVANRKGEGCIAVDMECASLAAVCQFRGVEFYPFLYTEDNLDGQTWDPGLMGKQPQDAKEAYFKIALELAQRI